MFKYILRVNVGGWWLLLGVWRSGSPFAFSVWRSSPREYLLRFFWLEVSVSELPF